MGGWLFLLLFPVLGLVLFLVEETLRFAWLGRFCCFCDGWKGYNDYDFLTHNTYRRRLERRYIMMRTTFGYNSIDKNRLANSDCITTAMG